ncbi:unnamed protein product [Linum tenue]|uniref:Uncharacterized protein n=1 Tax=Linum tenue TaxID=586396 RepID=A0AAV0HW22_9ROSI|nr:unnamed protein product [Linum tenue]
MISRVKRGGQTSKIYAICQRIVKSLVGYYQSVVDEQSKREKNGHSKTYIFMEAKPVTRSTRLRSLATNDGTALSSVLGSFTTKALWFREFKAQDDYRAR